MDLGASFGAGVGFMPHGFCLLWQPELLWMLIISDAIIAAAYFSIPFTLIHFIRRQENLKFHGVFVMFSLFIFACGTGHLIEIANIWTPLYWLSAYVKAFTALVSLATAAALWPLIPRVSAYIDDNIRTRQVLTDANARLTNSMALLRRREGEMRESEQRYRLTVSNAPIGLATVSPKGEFITVNATLCRMLGYSEIELRELTFQEITHPEDLEQDLAQVDELLAGGADSYRMVKRYFRRDGSLVDAQLDVSILRDRDGRPIHFISQIQDITGRLRVESALRASERKLNELLQNLPTAVLVYDQQGRVEYANPAAERLLGVGRRYLKGRTAANMVAKFQGEDGVELAPEEHAVSRVLASAAPLQDQIIGISARDGSATSWAQVSAFPETGTDGGIERVIVTLVDITERKLLEQRLTREAQTDALTGMLNRRHFMQLAGREVLRARRHGVPLSLVMMDVDHFKRINDRHGHQAGDQVLRKLGEICHKLLRENDFACRLGGEEFALLFPETNSAQAEVIAERLRSIIASTIISAPTGAALRWTSSIGVATLQQKDEGIEGLVHRADTALYQAKADGRNLVRIAA